MSNPSSTHMAAHLADPAHLRTVEHSTLEALTRAGRARLVTSARDIPAGSLVVIPDGSVLVQALVSRTWTWTVQVIERTGETWKVDTRTEPVHVVDLAPGAHVEHIDGRTDVDLARSVEALEADPLALSADWSHLAYLALTSGPGAYGGHNAAAQAARRMRALAVDLAHRAETWTDQEGDQVTAVPDQGTVQVADQGPEQGARVRHLEYGDRGTVVGRTLDGRPVVDWDAPDCNAAQEDTTADDLEDITGLEGPDQGPATNWDAVSISTGVARCSTCGHPVVVGRTPDGGWYCEDHQGPGQVGQGHVRGSTYTPALVGLTGTTRHGERVRATGPALDPRRVAVVPIGDQVDPTRVETFTPQVAHVSWDVDQAPADQAGPRACTLCGSMRRGPLVASTLEGRPEHLCETCTRETGPDQACDDVSEDRATDHGHDVCPDCGNSGVKIGPEGYVPCARFLTCWADVDQDPDQDPADVERYPAGRPRP